MNQVFVIKDQETGRFLSWRSMPEDEAGQQMFITYTGLLGTDFFTFREEAEKVLDALQAINRLGKRFYIGLVNPDSLDLGNRIVEYASHKVECFAL